MRPRPGRGRAPPAGTPRLPSTGPCPFHRSRRLDTLPTFPDSLALGALCAQGPRSKAWAGALPSQGPATWARTLAPWLWPGVGSPHLWCHGIVENPHFRGQRHLGK